MALRSFGGREASLEWWGDMTWDSFWQCWHLWIILTLFFDNLDFFDNYWQFWQFRIFLDNFDNCVKFWFFLARFTFLLSFDNFWKCLKTLTICLTIFWTIFDNFWQLLQFLFFLQCWNFSNTNYNSDNFVVVGSLTILTVLDNFYNDNDNLRDLWPLRHYN